VIGVSPADSRVTVSSGEMSKGRFSVPSTLWGGGQTVWTSDDSGFVIGKVHGATVQAVTKINAYVHNQTRTGAEKAAVDLLRMAFGLHPSFIRSSFVPCGQKSLTFQVPAGKVMYITDVKFTAMLGDIDKHDKIAPEFSSDLEAARAFLKMRYPNLADALEQGEYDLQPVLSPACY